MAGKYWMERGWMENAVFLGEPLDRRSAWVWLIEKAAYKQRKFDIKGKTVLLRRGQLTASITYLAKAWGWSSMRCRRYVARLEADGMIDRSTDTGQQVITICNYEDYQAKKSPHDIVTDIVTDTTATQQRHNSDTKQNKYNKPLKGTAPKSVFDLGVELLVPQVSERKARALVGKWRGQIGDENLSSIIVAAHGKTDPAAYVTKVIKSVVKRAELRSAWGPGYVPMASGAGG